MSQLLVTSPQTERPNASRSDRLVGVAHLAILVFGVVALVARWNGTLWAEVLAAGGALTAVYSISIRRGSAELLKIDVWFAGLLLVWLGLFAYAVLTKPMPAATIKPSLAPSPHPAPARKVLHAYGARAPAQRRRR